MAGALELKLLTDIAQAVCCMAKTVTATPAPVAAVIDLQATTGGSDVPFSFPGNTTLYTSIEIENFSDTYWLQVILPVMLDGYSLFWVPPGGSKVLAVSAPLFTASGTITVYDTVGGVATTPAADFGIQVTLLKGS